MTFDSYCDKIYHRAYNTYTLHYIDENWSLVSRVLKTSLMEASHSAQNICTDFEIVVKDYQMETKNIVCITDSAANMVAACRLIGNHRVPCIAHKCNTLIQKDLMANNSVKEIPALLTKMRAGQKKLMYRFEQLRHMREIDNQNQLALLLNELCEIDDAITTEDQYVSEQYLDHIRALERNQNAFNGLKTMSNIRFGCLYKISKSYKENSSMLFK